MLKMQIIGHLGKDAVMHQHGTDNVLNFSVAHTDRFKDGNGVLVEKTTWIECSWWIDGRSTIGQYLKKGTLVWVEGIPTTRMWDAKDGKKACGLGVRIFQLQLLGGKREDNQGQPVAPQQTSQVDQGGYKPVDTPENSDDLPF